MLIGQVEICEGEAEHFINSKMETWQIRNKEYLCLPKGNGQKFVEYKFTVERPGKPED